METNSTPRKIIAWTILLSLLNPGFMIPEALAADTDVYTTVQTSATLAQPNILIILDTGDPMNVPEPWHEYPGPYDSHVEYLWNDLTFMNNITLDLSQPFLWPTTEYGNWGGQSLAGSCASAQGCQESTLPADRTALKNNALAYAAATPAAGDPDVGDPGLVNGGTPAGSYAGAGGRKYWRNYGGGRAARNDGLQDGRLVYWIPAVANQVNSPTPPSDFRLLAPSFNKWYGNLARLQGALPRGGITWGGALNDPLDQSPNAGTEASPAQTAYNQCKDSVAGQVTQAQVTAAGFGVVTSNDTGATTAWTAFYPSANVTVPMGLVPSTAYAPSSAPRNSGRYLGVQWQRWEAYGGTTLQNGTGGIGSYPTTAPTAGATGTIGAGSTVGNVGSTNVAAKGDFLGAQAAAQAGPAVAPYPVRDSYNTGAPFGSNSTPGTWGMPIRTQAAGNNAGWTSMKSDFGGYLFGEVTNSTYYVNLSYLATMLSLYQTKWNPSGSGTTVTAANVQWLAFMGNRDDATPTFGKVVGLEDYYDTGPSGLTLNVGAATLKCTRTCTLSPAATAAQAPATDANNQAHNWSPTGGANAAVCNTNTLTPSNGGNCAVNVPPACAAPTAGLNQYYTEVKGGCGWVGRQSVNVQGVGTWYYGGTCQGNCTGPGNVAGGAPCPGANPQAGNCSITGVSNPTVNGNVLPNAVLNNATNGCGNAGNVSQTCTAREAGAGATQWGHVAGATGCIYNATCASQTSSSGGATPQYYFVYPYANQETLLYHDCVSDDPNFANLNAGNGYMYKSGRTFGTGFNTNVGGGLTQGYNAALANSVQATAQAVDMYSVNYLNWYYGPKSNGNPIGRKTRLQIAKDALITLVQSTNNVRFGLMNYNLTSNDGSFTDVGAHVTFSITPMGTTNMSDPLYANTASNPNLPPVVPNYTVTNRNAIISAINSMVAGSRSPVTEALYEAYLYFRGEAPWGGLLTNCGAPTVTVGGGPTVTVGTGSTCGGAAGSVTAGAYINNNTPINNGNDNAGANSQIPAICTAAQVTSGQCAAGSVGTKYASPMMNNPSPPNTTQGVALCQKNFVLFVTEGQSESDGLADSLIEPLTQTINGTVVSTQQATGSHQFETLTAQTAGPYCSGAAGPLCNTDQSGSYQDPGSSGYIWMDELSYYMSVADMNVSAALPGVQPVITYTIAFGGQTSPVIANAATVAGTPPQTAQSSQQLVTALQNALTAIIAWHPSSSTPAVPISSQNRTQSSTDVYLAFFGPTSNANWPGTVKKYHLDTNPPDCVDDQGNDPAVCLVGQTILPPQNSYNIEHTTTDASGNKLTVVNPMAESFWATVQDGGNANLGGTGYQLLVNANPGSPAARNMYTYVSAAATTNDLTNGSNAFVDTNGNITAAAMGGVSAATRQLLINWARGGDITQAACMGASSACNVWSAWPHAAVLHSVPTVVTYDSTLNPPTQTLFYVSTDGVLHAVGTQDGHELWSFIIEEAYPLLNTLMLNYAGAPVQVADGSPALYTQTDGQGHLTTAYLYFGQRRGGNAYYALDVTNRLTPKLLFKINPTCLYTGGSSSCTASPYTALGQTWSTPAVVNVGANLNHPTLVIGGGYDPNEDNVNPAPGTDTMGQAIYFIHGFTGGLIQGYTTTNLASMNCAIPSNPAALNMDSNAQGLVNRVYIGDTCAHLFRVDTAGSSTATWHLSLLSDLGAVDSGYAHKIFFPPVVVREGPSQAFGERFDAVYVGTGDHENPLAHTTPPTNHMFMIKDFATGFSPMAVPANATTLWDITASTDVGGNLTAGEIATFTAKPGWQFDFAAPGEKLSASPEVIGNILNFGTYSPTLQLNTCLPPGLGQLYGINAITGGTVNTQQTPGYVVTASTPKTYAGMNGRGYVAPGGIIVLGGQVYRITIVDGALHTIPAGSLAQARSYWQKEPQF